MVDGYNRPPVASVDSDVTSDGVADSTQRVGPPGPLTGPASGPFGVAGGTLPPGTMLDGRYQLASVAAARGPVTLWKGDDRILARAVAVRVIEHGPDDAADPDAPETDLDRAADLLLSAAINSGRLVHPGAASTYDATSTATPDGRVSYVVSEWVDGTSLQRMLIEGPLRPPRAAAIVLAAARVIAAAHARGLTHGDLHPGDVIVAGHGAVKVTDLEIGAAVASLEGRAPDVSPLIVPDARERDLVCLGALLYAALTASWPLAADRGLPSPPTVSDGRICTPRQVRAGVPRELEALTLACLGDERAERPALPSAAELVAELELLAPGDDLTDPDFAPGDDETTRVAGSPGVPTQAVGAATGADTRAGGGPIGPPTSGYPPPGRDNDWYAAPPTSLGPRRGAPPGAPPPRRRSLAIPLIALITIAAVIAIIFIALNREGGSGTPTPSASPTTATVAPLVPVAVSAFDPRATGGDGVEDSGEAANVLDGNPATTWHTEHYIQQISATKPGVGLVFDFGHAVTPKTVTVTIVGGQTTFDLRAGDAASAALAGYPQVTDATTGQNGPNTVTVPGATAHRYWVVWLTGLPQQTSGPDAGKYIGGIAEVSFHS